MKIGDLIRVLNLKGINHGTAVILGMKGTRGTERINDPSLLEIFWKGRVATLDMKSWVPEVISEDR